MKPIRFRSEARRELNEAIRYYNKERRGLGTRFLKVAEQAFDRIQETPSTGGPWDRATRLLSLMPRRFPYGIIFKEYDTEILIFSVYHLHRRGDDWYDRLESENE